MMREDKQLLMITHLSQLITLILGFGSLLVPLAIWVTQKESVSKMDNHGKQIINFQLSLIVYALVCIPLILLFGLGLIGFVILGLIAIAFPIINAIRVSDGKATNYPLSFSFIS